MNTCTYQIQTFKYVPNKKVKTIEERKEAFRLKLVKWFNSQPQKVKNEFPAWMRKDWFGYWTELANDNGRKMRFEMEKTWNTGRRLSTAKRTIYAKDPRWKTDPSITYKPPTIKSNVQYSPIDYTKAKQNANSNEILTAGERMRRSWEGR